MKYRELINLLEIIAPVEPYRDIDNSGEQIYTGKEDINRVLVCLEINRDIIKGSRLFAQLTRDFCDK